MKISIVVAALTLGLAAVLNASAQSNTVTRETTITIGGTEPSPGARWRRARKRLRPWRRPSAIAAGAGPRCAEQLPFRRPSDYRKLMAEAGGASLRHP